MTCAQAPVRRLVLRMITTFSGWLNSFMKPFCLINAGLDVFFDTGLLEVLAGNTPIVEFIALFARWPVTAVGTCVGQIQSRVATQLGNQKQTVLARPV